MASNSNIYLLLEPEEGYYLLANELQLLLVSCVWGTQMINPSWGRSPPAQLHEKLLAQY